MPDIRNSNIILIKMPLHINNKNQLTFANKTAQSNYFQLLNDNLELKIEDEFQYIRKDGIVYYYGEFEDLIGYNYCMYQNPDYSNKWFYAYITNMEYVTDNTTAIAIKTDVWQTWQFDIELMQSFVEREIVNKSNDIPGNYLIPEGLEMGETINNSIISMEELDLIYCIAFNHDKLQNQTDNGSLNYVNFDNTSPNVFVWSMNGLPTSVNLFICTFEGLMDAMKVIHSDNKTDGIMTIFTLPRLAVGEIFTTTIKGRWNTVNNTSPTMFSPKRTLSINNLPTSLDGYTPKNQKLRTYPYCYFGFTAQNSTSKIFRFENFNGQPNFKVMCEINPNPQIVFIPQNYKKTANNIGESVFLTGFPNISFTTEYFNTWLAQNQNIISVNMQQEQFNYEIDVTKKGIDFAGNMVSSTLGLGGENAKLGQIGVGAITEGANFGLNMAKADKNHEFYISQQMAQIEKQALLPNNSTLGSSNATLMGYQYLKENIFTVYTIKSQFAKIIDNYFDMYGYLINDRKIPNIKGRSNWNYIKTIGANIKGNILQNDLQEIKNMFDNGLTLWHKPEDFLDYSKSNS